jgi:hypothetical protein
MRLAQFHPGVWSAEAILYQRRTDIHLPVALLLLTDLSLIF